MAVVFVTGPVSSGKSAYAARLALESGCDVTYIATAAGEFEDVEWRGRLMRHVRVRPPGWRTVETAGMTHAAQLALFKEAPAGACLLVDALGTWLDARIADRIDLLEIDYGVLASQLDEEAAQFVDAMLASPCLGAGGERADRLGRRPYGCGRPLSPRCDGPNGSAPVQVRRPRLPGRRRLRARPAGDRQADRRRTLRLGKL